MPHAILEYTENILDDADFVHLFERLHAMLAETGGCNPDEMRSRALRLDHYRMGNGDERNAFAHLTIKLQQGRPEDLLARMGQAALELLKEHFVQALEDQRCDLTVEIQEIPRQCYFKVSSAER